MFRGILTSRILLLAFLTSSAIAPLATAAPPANDSFANAITLTGTFDSAISTTVDATRETGEPAESEARTTWFKWQAPDDGRARFSMEQSTSEHRRVSLWVGASLPTLTYLGRKEEYTDDPILENVPVKAGKWYYICAGHQGDGSGRFDKGAYTCAVVLDTNSDLNSRSVSSGRFQNDTFANATGLTGTNDTSIAYALKAINTEPGEPTRNLNKTMWWTWTAPSTGRTSLSLAGTELPGTPYYDYYADKCLVVYAVDSYAEMTTASPVAYRKVPSGIPSLVFNSTQGETYYIASGTQTGGLYDVSWRVMTLQHTYTPPPPPSVSISSPRGRLGKTLPTRATIIQPGDVSSVKWIVTGRRYLDADWNGGSSSSIRTLRKVGRPFRKWRTISVIVQILDDQGALLDKDTRRVRTKYRRYR